MVDAKKEQERDELHRAIWSITDDLRGSIDGWDFKSYVLGIMFYRYISENLTNYINADERAAGVLAPKSKADMAFIMHSLAWLATNGTAAIVCFPGIMYRGGAEKKIRQYLVDNNFIDTIIQLPGNLFYGTSIATCIMVLKKSKSENKTLFIDASNEFIKITNNNKLTEENLQKIVDAFVNREQIDKIIAEIEVE